MSAIFGMLSFSKKIDGITAEKMKGGYSDCKIDRYSVKAGDRLIMGCAEQFLIEGAEREQFPYEDSDCCFVMDGMVDDKTAVAAELGLSPDTPDGAVMLAAFKRWRFEFGEHLYGAFSACFYDKKAKKMYLFTDHTACRCIYYRKTDDAFYFSTLVKPILNVAEEKIGICEQWITYWGLNSSPSMYVVPDLSPFEGVYQLEPHRVLVVDESSGTAEKVSYWDPRKHVKEYKVSDEEGLALFRDTMDKCMRGILRASKETAATLSSGLDSSTVACLAVRALSERGKKLYSFTSVPLEGFNEKVPEGRVADETDGVMKIVGEYPDIIPSFLSCPDKNAVKDAMPVTRILEVPYKATVNTVWMEELYKKSAAKGCSMLLTGQTGNGTISYGSITNTAYRLVRSGHLVQAVKELNTFGKRWRYPRKKLAGDMVTTFFSARLSKPNFTGGKVIKDELIDKYKALKMIKKNMGNLGNMQMDKKSEQMNFMWSDAVLNNLAMYETKFGLYYGICNRDITRHPVVMSLIAGLPVTCTCGSGMERRLIRDGMHGIVPKYTRYDVTKRGLQSADLAYRMEHAGDATEIEAKKRLNDKAVEHYLDTETLGKIRTLFGKYKFNREAEKDMHYYLHDLFLVCSLSAFLEQYGR